MRNSMFRILLILFILVPIIEIAAFIRVGEALGTSMTIFIVIVTAILGVTLLRQQGFRAWRDIQLSMAQGNIPAIEMAAGAQLLFAGGLLLTPGFVTDAVGFILMIPQVRRFLAKKMIKKGILSARTNASDYSNQQNHQAEQNSNTTLNQGRTVEGEFEKKK